MTIKRDGWLFKYGYSFELVQGNRYLVPSAGEKINLCNFFWRTVFTTIVWSGIITIVSGALFLLGWATLSFVLALLTSHAFRIFMLMATGIVAVFVGLVLSLLSYITAVRRRREEMHERGEKPPPNELWKLTKEYAKGWKEKYCPIIEVE